jgi:undecaprenyl-diphosphatase
MLLTVAVASGMAIGLLVLVGAIVDNESAEAVARTTDVAGPVDHPEFPSALGLAAAAGIVTAAAPWIPRWWRRIAWVPLVGLAAARFATAPVAFDTLDALLVGWLSGSAALVALGAPSRRPTKEAVVAGLGHVGVPIRQLDAAGVDARGSTPYFGVTAEGARVFVKALGQDERSADTLFRMYRRVQRHDLGDEKPFSSLRRTVEHEALVALAARDIGARTPRLIAFTEADPNGFVLAYEAVAGKSLDRVNPAGVDDTVLAAIWEQVNLLRRHRIAHRDLRLANIFLGEDGSIWMIDFGFSELAASELLLASDLSNLIASSALQVGPERAVASALAAVGPGALESSLSRLRPYALSGATRSSFKARPGLMDDLRHRIAAACENGPSAG